MFPHHKLEWNTSRLEKAVAELPDDPSTRLEYAQHAISRALFHDGGEMWFNKALTAARRVLQYDPGNPGAGVIAGLALVGLERLDHAAQYLDEVVRTSPERADVHLGLGLLHEGLRDYHSAVKEFEAACRYGADSWETHWHLGRTLSERAELLGSSKRLLERSQFHVVRALQLDPPIEATGPMWFQLGVGCLKAQRWDEAYRLFSKLADHRAWKAKAGYFLGISSFHLGRYKNAVLHLRQHLEHQPEHPAVWSRIAMAYLHLGEIAKAREACNRALAVEPGNLQARWTLGCALLEEQRVEDAVKAFKEILEDAPDHVPAFSELVRIRKDTGDQKWLRKALRSEVAVHDRLPAASSREDPTSGAPVRMEPRKATRDRIQVLLDAMAEGGGETAKSLLECMDLTVDEGLRFYLWEAALDRVARDRAASVGSALEKPGTAFGANAGREILILAPAVPEKRLTQGLQIAEEDLKRAAVDRHGHARDVAVHRKAIEEEREAARAWQALLLIALSAHDTRSVRNLLLRWVNDADPELGDAARTALALLGDEAAREALRPTAKKKKVEAVLDQMIRLVKAPEVKATLRPVGDDEPQHCSTCGRRPPEAEHMLAGASAVMCSHCFTDVARQRRSLQSDDPGLACALCRQTLLESRAVYVYRGIPVCADCVEHSLGLVEREVVERWLAAS